LQEIIKFFYYIPYRFSILHAKQDPHITHISKLYLLALIQTSLFFKFFLVNRSVQTGIFRVRSISIHENFS